LQNSPLESSCVVVALIENYSTSKPLNISPEKSQILNCDTVAANEGYVRDKLSHDNTSQPRLSKPQSGSTLHPEGFIGAKGTVSLCV
jgi:hypothetical protein